MGLIESRGSGIPRVRRELAEAGLREPEFLDIDGLMRVNLWRPTTDQFAARLRGEEAIETDSRAMGDRLGPLEDRLGPLEDRLESTGTDRELQIVAYLRRSEFASAPELARHLGVTDGYARKLLRRLVEKSVVVKIGDNRYARYELPQE